jgi:phosphatidate cytidylyltransferase
VGAESGLLVASGVLGTVLATSAAAVVRKDHRGAFLPFLVSLLGVLSCGLALSYLLRIYRNPDGILLGIVFLLGIKGNDIVAYFVGSTLGRVRFLTVSPKKSLEGFLAAWIFGAVWFGGVAWLWPDRFFAWPLGAALGIILSLASQVGDLTESLLKRFHGVKDSSVLLPEFGGVLDLVDSFLYCGFLFWICLGG